MDKEKVSQRQWKSVIFGVESVDFDAPTHIQHQYLLGLRTPTH